MHDHLSIYLEDIEKALRNLKGVYIERYEEEILTSIRMNLRIRIRFQNNELLEFNEAVIADDENRVTHLGYRYHFQDKNNQLIFRYDNTPHHPGIESFPHHKHTPDNVAAVNQKPTIPEAIKEAQIISDLSKKNQCLH